MNCRGYTMLDQVLDWKDVRDWVHEVRQIPGASFTLDTKEGFYTESKDPEFLDLVLKGYQSKMTCEEDVLAQERAINKVALYHKTDIPKIAERMLAHPYSPQTVSSITEGCAYYIW